MYNIIATFTTDFEVAAIAARQIRDTDGFFTVAINGTDGGGCTVNGKPQDVMFLIGRLAEMGEDGLVDVSRLPARAAA